MTGDVFEGLPAGPEIDAIANFGVAGDCANLGVGKMRDQVGDGIARDDTVSIDADTAKNWGLVDELED